MGMAPLIDTSRVLPSVKMAMTRPLSSNTGPPLLPAPVELMVS